MGGVGRSGCVGTGAVRAVRQQQRGHRARGGASAVQGGGASQLTAAFGFIFASRRLESGRLLPGAWLGARASGSEISEPEAGSSHMAKP